jgi:hypothetical protein
MRAFDRVAPERLSGLADEAKELSTKHLVCRWRQQLLGSGRRWRG